MRVSRNIGGRELAKLLKKYGYEQTRQAGSHIRLTTNLNGEHHITIPNHKPLRIGTFNNIISDIAEHLEIPKQKLLNELF